MEEELFALMIALPENFVLIISCGHAVCSI